MFSDPIFSRLSRPYPRNWQELCSQFPDERACVSYLEQLRWGRGFSCPKCSCTKGWRLTDGRWSCAGCARKTSVTAGTIFDRSRLTLREWFAAAWHLTDPKRRLSALSLQELLGLGSYQTAWTILQKLRTAMVRPGLDRLRGSVEVLEISISATENSPPRRTRASAFSVAIALEALSPIGFGRVRLHRVEDMPGANLIAFIYTSVEPGAEVCTVDSPRFDGLSELGFRHMRFGVSNIEAQAQGPMEKVYKVASILNRWLLDAHHGPLGADHLDTFLGECELRFNRRLSRQRGFLFLSLLQHAVVTPPTRYRPSRYKGRIHIQSLEK